MSTNLTLEQLPLATYLAQQAQKIESHLEHLIRPSTLPYGTLFEAARYSLFSGGKRIRPILTLATCQALGGNSAHALTPACTIELIHTYSMIHDDLPCMDNDDFRRGKPTLHKVVPESLALLAGDYLLTVAFEWLAKAPELSAEIKVKLVNILSSRAGGEGMIGGQVLDIAAQAATLADIELIHRCKTGALIEAAITMGALVAEASTPVLEELQAFGQEIGLAFQIVDDILDVTSSEQKHGKKIGSDLQNGKTTYVTLLGLEAAQGKAEELLQTAIKRLSHLPIDPGRLTQLAQFLVHRSI